MQRKEEEPRLHQIMRKVDTNCNNFMLVNVNKCRRTLTNMSCT